jgi:peptide/nickel transport system substrate-binding protein
LDFGEGQAIVSEHSAKKEMAVLGAFYVSEYKPAQFVLLARNPNYWKHDAAGNSLPYLDSVRLEIQRNRDIEMLRFRRGEIHLINRLDAEYFDRLSLEMPGFVHDSGPGLDSEQMWFNQATTSPLPDYEKAWFRSTEFRVAVSKAINREDIARIVFAGHAQQSYGPVSPANHFWFNAVLPAPKFDQTEALQLLEKAGFRKQGSTLRDSSGHAVEFSLVTNAGNKLREQMSAMIQQDLSQIGMNVRIVTLDFPSLIERMTRTFNYEARLLGLVNDDLDPNSQMNVWLSSASDHQWNPNEPAPATTWEAEIDHLMREQASELDPKKRKKAFDRVQQIVSEQQPFIYLVRVHEIKGGFAFWL